MENHKLSRKGMEMIEVCGSLVGIAGAAWLALKLPGFGYAYVLFFFSSLILSYYFIHKKQWWVLAQQVIFAMVNLVGIIVWLR